MKKTSLTLWLLFAAAMFALGGCAGAGTKTGNAVDDTVITTKVKSAFVGDQKVSAMNIGVETNQGVVTLTGTAKDWSESAKAAELARGVQGVRTVHNNITVKN
jgi:osmotically-inducible protein OsmY